jgi:hypothetical protein
MPRLGLPLALSVAIALLIGGAPIRPALADEPEHVVGVPTHHIITRAEKLARKQEEFERDHPFLVRPEVGPGNLHDRAGDGLVADGSIGLGVADMTTVSSTDSGGAGIGAGGLLRSAEDRIDGLRAHGEAIAVVSLYHPGVQLQGEIVGGKKFTDWKCQPGVSAGLHFRAGYSHGYIKDNHPEWSRAHSPIDGLAEAAVAPSARFDVVCDINDLSDFVSVSALGSETFETSAVAGSERHVAAGGNVTVAYSRKLASLTVQKALTGEKDRYDVDFLMALHMDRMYMGFNFAVSDKPGPKYDPSAYVPDDSHVYQATFVVGSARIGAH